MAVAKLCSWLRVHAVLQVHNNLCKGMSIALLFHRLAHRPGGFSRSAVLPWSKE